MTYLEWVQLVFERLAHELAEGDEMARNLGLDPHRLPGLFNVGVGNEGLTAVDQAVRDLDSIAVLNSNRHDLISLGSLGHYLVEERTTTTLAEVWPVIFRTRQLSARHHDLMVIVVKGCERERDGFTFQEMRWLHEVAGEAGLIVSPGDGIGFYEATTGNDLTEGIAVSGGVQIRPTYAGIVRATMRENERSRAPDRGPRGQVGGPRRGLQAGVEARHGRAEG